jgi:hypothetical protein
MTEETAAKIMETIRPGTPVNPRFLPLLASLVPSLSRPEKFQDIVAVIKTAFLHTDRIDTGVVEEIRSRFGAIQRDPPPWMREIEQTAGDVWEVMLGLIEEMAVIDQKRAEDEERESVNQDREE